MESDPWLTAPQVPKDTDGLSSGKTSPRCSACRCCCFSSLVLIIAVCLALAAKARTGAALVPAAAAPALRLGLRATVADATSFARRIENDPRQAARLRHTLAKMSGVEDSKLSHLKVVADPAAGHAESAVSIEFEAPVAAHVPQALPPAQLAADFKEAFSTEVTAASATVASEFTARCTLDLHVVGGAAAFCEGLLAAGIDLEQRRIREEALSRLPHWLGDLAVGYTAPGLVGAAPGQLVLQPTLRLASEADRRLFGAAPGRKLRCTLESVLRPSVFEQAAREFAKYSDGKCVFSPGNPRCAAVDAGGLETGACSPGDAVPVH